MDGTDYQAIRLAATDTALGVFVNNKEIVIQKVYDGANGYLYLVVGTEKVACTIRKLSGGAVGTGGGGDVTAAGNNTFTGINTFNGDVRVNGISSAQLFKVQLDESSTTYATYGFNFIGLKVNNDNKVYQLQLPYKNDTIATLNDIPTVTHKYLHQLYITGRDTTEEDFAINALYVNNSDTLITTYNQLLTAVAVRRMPATGYCGGAHSTKFVSYLEQSKNQSNFITIHTFNSNGSTAIDINSGAIPGGGIIDTMTVL